MFLNKTKDNKKRKDRDKKIEKRNSFKNINRVLLSEDITTTER